MKKLGLLSVCLLLTLVVMSQKSVIAFSEKVNDFGKIYEEDGKVTKVFTFKNAGTSPLVINRVQASCGCTTPTWTKEPIEPGKLGSITVTYNPLGRPGSFTKSITVYSNATEEQINLLIKGDVIPKQSGTNDLFPVKIGGLGLKSKVVQMNNIEKGAVQMRSFEIENSSTSTIKPTIENLPSYMSAKVTPETLKPEESGKVSITFNSKVCNLWGPVSDDIYLVVNGRRIFSEDYRISVVANIVEDFGKLTLDQKRKSPIIEMSTKTVNLGVVKVGSKYTGKFKITNRGSNPLEIRRVLNNNKELDVRNTKLHITNGRTSNLAVDLYTKNLVEGNYKKSITIQTNDPDNSFLILVLSWTVKK